MRCFGFFPGLPLRAKVSAMQAPKWSSAPCRGSGSHRRAERRDALCIFTGTQLGPEARNGPATQTLVLAGDIAFLEHEDSPHPAPAALFQKHQLIDRRRSQLD